MPQTSIPKMILRRPQVEQVTGLKRSTIYAWISQGLFPRPISLGGRAVGWLASDIDAWLVCRIEQSRFHTAARREMV